MNRQEIETIVLKVLSTVLKCEVTLESERNQIPQWDSLKHIEVLFAVEDELGLQFAEEELASLDTVSRIVEKSLIRYAT